MANSRYPSLAQYWVNKGRTSDSLGGAINDELKAALDAAWAAKTPAPAAPGAPAPAAPGAPALAAPGALAPAAPVALAPGSDKTYDTVLTDSGGFVAEVGLPSGEGGWDPLPKNMTGDSSPGTPISLFRREEDRGWDTLPKNMTGDSSPGTPISLFRREEDRGWDTLPKNMTGYSSPGNTNIPDDPNSGSGGGNIDLSNLGLPQVNEEFNSTLATLSGMLPQYQKSMDFLSGLPDMIDQYTQDQIKGTRVRGDDINEAFSQAANLRAGRGIMGGTESDNLRAKLLGQVRDRVEEKRFNLAREGMLAKTSLGPAVSQEMGRSAALLGSMFGTSAEANINVGNLIARMMEAGYTG